MIISLLLLLLGCAILLWGADQLVKGSSNLALKLGLSTLFIGLTIVAFGTSAPELTVSLLSVMNGSDNLAVGNVVGSNIANVLIIIGICAFLKPLSVNKQILSFDLPIMLAASIIFYIFAKDGKISVLEGVFFVLFYITYILISLFLSKKSVQNSATTTQEESTPKSKWYLDTALVIIGLTALIGGAKLAVSCAIDIATACGVSELLIGLTVVAIGTSLPEIAASSVATFRGNADIAIGNALGSNIANILLIIGICAVYSMGELSIPEMVFKRDLPVMLGSAFICFPIFFTGSKVVRWEGLFLLLCYALYVTNCAFQESNNTPAIITEGSFYILVIGTALLTIKTIYEIISKIKNK